MKYVVVSTAVTDDITLADGTKKGKFLGGAGSYALAGLKLWCDDVQLVTGVGEDFKTLYYNWFSNNNIDIEPLFIKDKYTAVSIVQYLENGERDEQPLYGKDHYMHLEATPEELNPFLKVAKGVYIFKDNNEEYWMNILRMKREYSFQLMWEINAGCAIKSELESVKKIAEQLDIISINKTELCSLFDSEIDNAIEEVSNWDVPMVFLRLGANGSIIIKNKIKYVIPSVKNVEVVDVTGGGNSSSTGVLFGYCEGYDPISIGVMGSISASKCIQQYGLPTLLTDLNRAAAKELLKQMVKEVEHDKR